MLIEIPDVLSSGEVARIRGALAGMTFVDGRASAGAQASAVKNNEEIPPCNEVMELAKLIGEGLARHQTFNHFALPRKIMAPIFSRYKDGMNYGSHSDVSVMQIGNPERAIRTDLSITVFLSDPKSYDGGALVISTHVGEQSFKLAPGSAVVYPSQQSALGRGGDAWRAPGCGQLGAELYPPRRAPRYPLRTRRHFDTYRRARSGRRP